MEIARQITKQWTPVLCQYEAESSGCLDGVGQLEELRRLQTTPAGRAIDPRPDVVRPADPNAGSFLDQGACLVRFIERPRHDHGLVARFEGLGQTASGRERCVCRKPLPDERKLEQVL